MFQGYLTFDKTDPVVGGHWDDAHNGELIDGCCKNNGIEKDIGKLGHKQVDALVFERQESYTNVKDAER